MLASACRVELSIRPEQKSSMADSCFQDFHFHCSTLRGRLRSISCAYRRDSASMSLACTRSEMSNELRHKSNERAPPKRGVNRRPTWTPGETAIRRCSQTIFEKKDGVTVEHAGNKQFRFCFNDLVNNRGGIQVGRRFTCCSYS